MTTTCEHLENAKNMLDAGIAQHDAQTMTLETSREIMDDAREVVEDAMNQLGCGNP